MTVRVTFLALISISIVDEFVSQHVYQQSRVCWPGKYKIQHSR